MDFLLSEDLIPFRETLRKFFSSDACSAPLKKAIERGQSAIVDGDAASPEVLSASVSHDALWKDVVELGVLAAAIPEEFDGLDLGFIAAELVIEESARCLFAPPLFETLAFFATPLLVAGSSEQREKFLPLLAAGDLRASGSLQDLTAEEVQQALPSKDVLRYEKGKLSASVSFVPACESSQAFMFFEAPSNLYLLDARNLKPESLAVTPLETFDLIRSYSVLSFSDLPAEHISLNAEDFAQISRRIEVLCAAELVGLSSRVLEMTIDYVKTRKQFGTAIGSFQAVQHKLADMHLSYEQARSLTRFAASAADSDREQFSSAAIAAKAFASDVLPKLVEDSIQIHGGIGFTYEYELHLYLRRAKMLAGQYTAASEGYVQLAQALINA
jgi:alkylation response protein AidB-like acyl-CoA dehydrogenase